MKRRFLPIGTVVVIPGGGQFTVDATEVPGPDGPRTVTVKILAREAAARESGADSEPIHPLESPESSPAGEVTAR